MNNTSENLQTSIHTNVVDGLFTLAFSWIRQKLNSFAFVVLFYNTRIALPSMGLLAPDHLRQDICSPYIGTALYGFLAGGIPTRF